MRPQYGKMRVCNVERCKSSDTVRNQTRDIPVITPMLRSVVQPRPGYLRPMLLNFSSLCIIPRRWGFLGGFRVLLTVELSSVHHVGESGFRLRPLAGLEPTVGVNPELIWLEILKHLVDSDLDLLLTWYAR